MVDEVARIVGVSRATLSRSLKAHPPAANP
jgi:hypothetical protein